MLISRKTAMIDFNRKTWEKKNNKLFKKKHIPPKRNLMNYGKEKSSHMTASYWSSVPAGHLMFLIHQLPLLPLSSSKHNARNINRYLEKLNETPGHRSYLLAITRLWTDFKVWGLLISLQSSLCVHPLVISHWYAQQRGLPMWAWEINDPSEE